MCDADLRLQDMDRLLDDLVKLGPSCVYTRLLECTGKREGLSEFEPLKLVPVGSSSDTSIVSVWTQHGEAVGTLKPGIGRQLEREIGSHKSLSALYMPDALAGDYGLAVRIGNAEKIQEIVRLVRVVTSDTPGSQDCHSLICDALTEEPQQESPKSSDRPTQISCILTPVALFSVFVAVVGTGSGWALLVFPALMVPFGIYARIFYARQKTMLGERLLAAALQSEARETARLAAREQVRLEGERARLLSNRAFAVLEEFRNPRCQNSVPIGWIGTDYSSYLESPLWKKRRTAKFAEVGSRRCEARKCPKPEPSQPVHVHHLTYERLGYERMSDLLILCPYCHEKIHEKNVKESTFRSAYARWLVADTLGVGVLNDPQYDGMGELIYKERLIRVAPEVWAESRAVFELGDYGFVAEACVCAICTADDLEGMLHASEWSFFVVAADQIEARVRMQQESVTIAQVRARAAPVSLTGLRDSLERVLK